MHCILKPSVSRLETLNESVLTYFNKILLWWLTQPKTLLNKKKKQNIH